jgi:hypothetical protein
MRGLRRNPRSLGREDVNWKGEGVVFKHVHDPPRPDWHLLCHNRPHVERVRASHKSLGSHRRQAEIVQLYSGEKHGTGSVLKSVPRNSPRNDGGYFRKWAWFSRYLSVTQAFAVAAGILQVSSGAVLPRSPTARESSSDPGG